MQTSCLQLMKLKKVDKSCDVVEMTKINKKKISRRRILACSLSQDECSMPHGNSFIIYKITVLRVSGPFLFMKFHLLYKCHQSLSVIIIDGLKGLENNCISNSAIWCLLLLFSFLLVCLFLINDAQQFILMNCHLLINIQNCQPLNHTHVFSSVALEEIIHQNTSSTMRC